MPPRVAQSVLRSATISDRNWFARGLKTAAMAEESRFNTIVTFFECSQSQVTFGVLFSDDRCANIFEALVGTLRAAKDCNIRW